VSVGFGVGVDGVITRRDKGGARLSNPTIYVPQPVGELGSYQGELGGGSSAYITFRYDVQTRNRLVCTSYRNVTQFGSCLTSSARACYRWDRRGSSVPPALASDNNSDDDDGMTAVASTTTKAEVYQSLKLIHLPPSRRFTITRLQVFM
jgi:hypothetical protein